MLDFLRSLSISWRLVLEEICDLSARMVVNQVSLKMEQERIRKLIYDLRKLKQQ